MRITIGVFFLMVTTFQGAFCQTSEETLADHNKGSIYLTWGYHLNAYSPSTIHLKDYRSDNYDFTLYDAKAKDQPDMEHLLKSPLTVPQYVFRFGYFFEKRNGLGVEFSWDHLKYVVIDNQMLHLTGWIHDKYYDLDTLVTPEFVHVEHTNGNNYAMISAVKRSTLFQSVNGICNLSGMFSLGGGVLVPKTDSTVLGNHNDGPFRYSGIVFAGSAGLRYELFRYFYIEPSIKGAFADYTNAKVYLQGRAQHHFFSVQYVLAAGINYPLGN